MLESVKNQTKPLTSSCSEDASQALRHEILADAQRQAQKVLQRATVECDKIKAEALAATEHEVQQILETAEAQAARQRTIDLAIVPVEAGRYRALYIEKQLDALRAAALAQLRTAWQSADTTEALLALTIAAIRGMSGQAFTLHLAPADYARLQEDFAWQERLRATLHRPNLKLTLQGDLAVEAYGVVIRDDQKTQLWDNRLEARLERAWPTLRIAVAKELGLLE